MALIAAHPNAGAGVILVVTVQPQVYNLPLPPPPCSLPPFSPSLIHLTVSVDVKHHVYFRIVTENQIRVFGFIHFLAQAEAPIVCSHVENVILHFSVTCS